MTDQMNFSYAAASYSDKKIILDARRNDSRAIEELYRRYGKTFEAAALSLSRKINYEAEYTRLDSRSLKDRVLSDAYAAFVEAYKSYDFESCSFSSWIGTKVSWHFKTLLRNKARLCKVQSEVEFADNGGSISYGRAIKKGEGCVWSSADIDNGDSAERQRYVDDALKLVLMQAEKNPKDEALIKALLTAGENGQSDAYAAKVLGKTRQAVNKALHTFAKKLPKQVMNEGRANLDSSMQAVAKKVDTRNYS